MMYNIDIRYIEIEIRYRNPISIRSKTILLYIALITYASLYVAAFPYQDKAGKRVITACLIFGCCAAVYLFLSALGICEPC